MVVDAMVAPVFVADFLCRLLTAGSRRDWFVRRFGWADMIAIVPLLRIFRVFRIVRVVRLMRSFGSDALIRELAASRALSTFLLFAGIALFSVLTGFIANLFLSPAGRVRRRRLAPGSTAAQMLEVRRLLDEQEQRTAEIRSRLDELERTQVRERAQAR